MFREGPPKSPESEQVQIYWSPRDNEYKLIMPNLPRGGSASLPPELQERVLDAFKGTEWEVIDRGTRIEIHHTQEYGKRDDAFIRERLRTAFRDSFLLMGE